MNALKTFLILGCVSLFAGNRVEHLTPPRLDGETIATEIRCVRPMREGTFNISAGDVGDQFIVHCYGHGGCGWTTFMGSVERAIELFQRRYPDPLSAPPIRIIGSGCMGLCSAIELTRAGYQVTGITSAELYDIPSWNAAGYFALVSVKVAPEEEEAVNRINFSTFNSYTQIVDGRHPYLTPKAVRFLPVYCSEKTESGVQDLEQQGMIPPKEVVDLDFGNGVVHENFSKFMTYFFDVTTLMQELHAEAKRLGIAIEKGKVENFSELSESIVFNCAGLGGGDLARDEKMIPVRGHLAMLNEKAGTAHMDYMIYSKVVQDGKDEYVYLFPRSSYISPENPAGTACYGVLGGTFLMGAEKLPADELADLDRKELDRLLDRNSQFFHGTPFKK